MGGGSNSKTKLPRGNPRGRTKRVADSGEAADLVEVIVDPVQVQVPLGAVPVEVRAVAVAIEVLPHRTAKSVQRTVRNTAR